MGKTKNRRTTGRVYCSVSLADKRRDRRPADRIDEGQNDRSFGCGNNSIDSELRHESFEDEIAVLLSMSHH